MTEEKKDDQKAPFEKFIEYLDNAKLRKNEFDLWELQVLGGFGGYKSQVKKPDENR